jgi:hypothetical protein
VLLLLVQVAFCGGVFVQYCAVHSILQVCALLVAHVNTESMPPSCTDLTLLYVCYLVHLLRSLPIVLFATSQGVWMTLNGGIMQITKPGESLSGSTNPLFQSVDIKVRTCGARHSILVIRFCQVC